MTRHMTFILLCAGLLAGLLFVSPAASAQNALLFDLLIRARPEQLPTYDEMVAALNIRGRTYGFQRDDVAAVCLNERFDPWWVYEGGIVI